MKEELLKFIRWHLSWSPEEEYTLEENLKYYLNERRYKQPKLKEILTLDKIKKLITLI